MLSFPLSKTNADVAALPRTTGSANSYGYIIGGSTLWACDQLYFCAVEKAGKETGVAEDFSSATMGQQQDLPSVA